MFRDWIHIGVGHSQCEFDTLTCCRSVSLSMRLRNSRWFLMTAISIFSASFPNRVHLVLWCFPSAAVGPVRISLSEPINYIDHITWPLCPSISSFWSSSSQSRTGHLREPPAFRNCKMQQFRSWNFKWRLRMVRTLNLEGPLSLEFCYCVLFWHGEGVWEGWASNSDAETDENCDFYLNFN